jgi:hypothetical protein
MPDVARCVQEFAVSRFFVLVSHVPCECRRSWRGGLNRTIRTCDRLSIDPTVLLSSVGRVFAPAIILAPALEVADQLHRHNIRSAISKREFMKKVRRCVRGRSGPARSWEVCEAGAATRE